MIIENKSHYHNRFTRAMNIVPETDSFAFESSKRQAYAQRLYWHMTYTQNCNGQAFFYTFTYNENAIPKFLGRNCFNYDDVRTICNGTIYKSLRRNYGTQLDYFCACETGEGGVTHADKCFGYTPKRGAGNNPHYHVIFFLTPAKNSKKPYKKIDAFAFRELCRKCWQYQTDDKGNIISCSDWKQSKYGHVQEGNNLGLVNSSDCFSYVSKYVTKDSASKSLDKEVKIYYYNKIKHTGITNACLYCYYLRLKELIPSYTKYMFFRDFHLDDYSFWRNNSSNKNNGYATFIKGYDLDLDTRLSELNDYFINTYLPEMTTLKYREYHNQHGCKTRTSKSLGAYGIEFVRNQTTNPKFTIFQHNTPESCSPCLYYMRKLYYDKFYCNETDCTLYVLNDLGITLKLNQIESKISSQVEQLRTACDFFTQPNNSDYANYLHFPANSISDLFKLNDSDRLFRRYAIYNLVYRYRSFSPNDFICLGPSLDIDDIKLDYEQFLHSTPYVLDFDNNTVCQYVSNYRNHLISFASYPEFASYHSAFAKLDDIFTQYGMIRSDIKKHEFEQKGNLKKKLNALRFAIF